MKAVILSGMGCVASRPLHLPMPRPTVWPITCTRSSLLRLLDAAPFEARSYLYRRSSSWRLLGIVGSSCSHASTWSSIFPRAMLYGACSPLKKSTPEGARCNMSLAPGFSAAAGLPDTSLAVPDAGLAVRRFLATVARCPVPLALPRFGLRCFARIFEDA